MTTLALIADVHSNHLALEAVLADLRRRPPVDRVVNLGDNVNGPIDPQRSADLLRAHATVHVRGNGDRLTAAGGRTASTRFAAARIDAETRAWLAGLPLTARGDGWLACHGAPEDDESYLVERVTPAGAEPRPAGEIAARLAGVAGPLIACGHTHVPRIVALADGRTVVNPGSVGLPAYDDAQPHPHRMECGSPHARYARVRVAGDRVEAEIIAVEYDWDAAAELARRHGFADWVRPLRTGRV